MFLRFHIEADTPECVQRLPPDQQVLTFVGLSRDPARNAHEFLQETSYFIEKPFNLRCPAHTATP